MRARFCWGSTRPDRRSPLLFSSVAFDAATRAFAFLRRHYTAIQIRSGLVLVVMSCLVLSGQLYQLSIDAGTLWARSA